MVHKPVEQPMNYSNRRQFVLSGALIGLWGSIVAALAVPASLYLLLPPRFRKTSEWVEVGDFSGVEPGIPIQTEFSQTAADGWKVVSVKKTAWIVKLPSQDIVAFGPQCTHLGCAYHWEQSSSAFVCPCHTSVFNVEGKVVSGPAPRPLDRYETKLEGGKLLLGHLKVSA
jgi:menaquinol-cytochrome c reductase iron-sulfur subunit